MNILFAGNQPRHFVYPAPANVSYSSAVSGSFDSTWVPGAMVVLGDRSLSADILTVPNFGAQTDIWLHWRGYYNGYEGGTRVFFVALDNSGVPRVRLYNDGGSTHLEWWNGSTWIALDSVSNLAPAVLRTHDVHVVIDGASSRIDYFVDRDLYLSGTGDFSAIGNIAQCDFSAQGGTGSSFKAYISEAIVADGPTLTMRYSYQPPVADGAHTDFVGDYTDDLVYSETAGDIETYLAAARDFTNCTVHTVIVDYSALKGSGGPQSIQPVLRVGGVDYFGSTQGLNFGFVSYRAPFDTNPATSAAWTPSEAGDGTLEFGVKSIA